MLITYYLTASNSLVPSVSPTAPVLPLYLSSSVVPTQRPASLSFHDAYRIISS